MNRSIINAMYREQFNEGELSERIPCEVDKKWIVISNKIQKIASPKVCELVSQLEEAWAELSNLYMEKGYKQGVKDGVNLILEVKGEA